MLEQLQIQNFQAHTKLSVTFGPGITTIIGPSDVGKSAIIRALRWVCKNAPGGDAFVRHGTKGTTVKLTIDGRTITRKRKRGGDVNTYHLDDEEYKAFGRGVPDTIGHFLNMPDVCWQGQHDPSFWFGDTPGEVSRQLNAIVDLGIIDETLKNVGSTFHRARTKLELVEEELTEAKREHKAFAWVPSVEKELTKVELARGDAHTAKGRAWALRATVDVVQQHTAQLAALEGHAGATRGLFERARVAMKCRSKVASLRGALYEAAKAHDRVAVPVPDFTPVAICALNASKASRHARDLRGYLFTITQQEKTLCQLRKNLKAAIRALPEVCPTCGRF